MATGPTDSQLLIALMYLLTAYSAFP